MWTQKMRSWLSFPQRNSRQSSRENDDKSDKKNIICYGLQTHKEHSDGYMG